MDANIDSWDLKMDVDNERLTPAEDLKKVKIRTSTHQVKKIDTSLTEEE